MVWKKKIVFLICKNLSFCVFIIIYSSQGSNIWLLRPCPWSLTPRRFSWCFLRPNSTFSPRDRTRWHLTRLRRGLGPVGNVIFIVKMYYVRNGTYVRTRTIGRTNRARNPYGNRAIIPSVTDVTCPPCSLFLFSPSCKLVRSLAGPTLLFARPRAKLV